MPRKSLLRSTTLPYHVTARANNREAFHCAPERTWQILAHQSLESGIRFGARIHALVMMPNHFHLLITTPAEDLGQVMEHFMKSATKTMNLFSGRSGRVFGGPYYWSLIDSPVYFAHALKYVYRNPVRANLCERAEHHAHSTLSGLLGSTHLPFPIHYPFGSSGFIRIPNDMTELLNWLNRPFKTEHQEAIQKALKRSHFQPPKSGWKRTLEALNSDLL